MPNEITKMTDELKTYLLERNAAGAKFSTNWAWWEEDGVFTLEQFHVDYRESCYQFISDASKARDGFRRRFDYLAMPLEELEAIADTYAD